MKVSRYGRGYDVAAEIVELLGDAWSGGIIRRADERRRSKPCKLDLAAMHTISAFCGSDEQRGEPARTPSYPLSHCFLSI
jgi:hypothetical protein